MSGFAPPLPAPSSSFPVIHTPLMALDSGSPSSQSFMDPELVSSMMGDDGGEFGSVFWKVAKSAAAFIVAYKVTEAMEKPAKTRRVVAWAAAGAAFLFL